MTYKDNVKKKSFLSEISMEILVSSNFFTSSWSWMESCHFEICNRILHHWGQYKRTWNWYWLLHSRINQHCRSNNWIWFCRLSTWLHRYRIHWSEYLRCSNIRITNKCNDLDSIFLQSLLGNLLLYFTKFWPILGNLNQMTQFEPWSKNFNINKWNVHDF